MKNNRCAIVVDVSSITNLFSYGYIGGVESDLLTLFVLYCLSKNTWIVQKAIARTILCKYQQKNSVGKKNDGGYHIRELKRNEYIDYINTGTTDVLVRVIKPLKQSIENGIRQKIAKEEISSESIPMYEINDIPDVYCKIWRQFYYRLPQADKAFINAADDWKLDEILTIRQQHRQSKKV